MERIAIVAPKFGKDINGGQELHVSLIANRLKDKYDITILSSCLNDKDEATYPIGENRDEGFRIIRFAADTPDQKKHEKAFRYLHKSRIYKEKKISITNLFSLLPKKIKYRHRKNHKQIFEDWVNTQNPHCSQLIEYIKNNQKEFSAFIFFGYWNYLTYAGLKEVPDKSILIPIAHNEATIYFDGLGKVFSLPRIILYNSQPEKELVESLHPEAKNTTSEIVGLGFEKPYIDLEYAKNKTIDYPFFVYIGRIHEHKGCKQMLEDFESYKQAYHNDYKLVLIGKNFMDVPKTSDNIVYLGFVDDQEKYFYLQHADALIIPSMHESLSMVTLEAMLMGKPVIANRKADVLKSHIEISRAGYTYENKEEFCDILNKVIHLSDNEKEEIAKNGISYVERNYQWPVIVNKFVTAIETIKTHLT